MGTGVSPNGEAYMILTDLFRKSRLSKREEYVSKEVEKMGTLRAGSSGIMSDEGEVAGSCVRKSHLRSLGIELDAPTEDKLIMFDLGFASEDIVFEKLISSLPAGHILLREEEIPIEWLTKNGTKVTGRPDGVICAPSIHGSESGGNVPILGIELKSVHSVWVAREVLFNRKPKLSNLIQAGHYMWKLGVPYKLVYTNYSQLGQGMAGNDWMAKMFPRPGEPGSEYVEFNKKNQIKHIRQFEIVYDLHFDESGRLAYKLEHESEGEWTPTLVTREGIEKYFEYVSEMAEKKQLGPRPSQVDTLGNKAGYKDCDYCPLKPTCDSKEKLGYDQWLEEVRSRDVNKSSGSVE